MLKPLISWLLPQIHAAQDEGSLPQVEPILIHYLLISLTSTLSGFGPEMRVTSNISPSDPTVVDAYWKMIEDLVFNRAPAAQDSGKVESSSGKVGRRARAPEGVKSPE